VVLPDIVVVVGVNPKLAAAAAVPFKFDVMDVKPMLFTDEEVVNVDVVVVGPVVEDEDDDLSFSSPLVFSGAFQTELKIFPKLGKSPNKKFSNHSGPAVPVPIPPPPPPPPLLLVPTPVDEGAVFGLAVEEGEEEKRGLARLTVVRPQTSPSNTTSAKRAGEGCIFFFFSFPFSLSFSLSLFVLFLSLFLSSLFLSLVLWLLGR